MAKAPPIPWAGLDRDMLDDLEQRICRCAIRKQVGGEGVGEAHAISKFMYIIISFIEQKLAQDPLVIGAELRHILKTERRGITAQEVNKFLAGTSHSTFWIDLAPLAFAFLLAGNSVPPEALGGLTSSTTEPSDSHVASMWRLCRYFFRRDSNNHPTFFALARLHFGEPCTLTELGGELAWHVRHAKKHQRSEKQSRFVFVSGEQAFPIAKLGDEENLLARQIIEAVESGDKPIEIIWIYAAEDTPAARSLKQFEQQNKNAKNKTKKLQSTTTEFGRGSFVHPTLISIFVNHDDDHEKSALWFVRTLPTPVPGEPPPSARPLAIEASVADRRAFMTWLKNVQESAADN